MRLVKVLLLTLIVGCFLSGCGKSGSGNDSGTGAGARSILATIETYKAPAPEGEMPGVGETYDARKSGNLPLPPTLTDTFIADIWQRMSMDLKLQGITKNHVSEDNVKQALNVYVERGWKDIAGYRPWTHSSFIKSLSPQDRETLAKEVVKYIETNGVKDVE
ncbi:MAG: hypothetical protein H0U54_17655 [Acidobacteria bacterium]|nr:hypothetical protein [Acidobacteriota bacterium]